MQKMRLVGGRYISQGRLEVYHDGRWGTVCDDHFDSDEATLMCRLLGYHSGVVDASAASPGSGQIWLDDVTLFITLIRHPIFLDINSLSSLCKIQDRGILLQLTHIMQKRPLGNGLECLRSEEFGKYSNYNVRLFDVSKKAIMLIINYMYVIATYTLLAHVYEIY